MDRVKKQADVAQKDFRIGDWRCWPGGKPEKARTQKGFCFIYKSLICNPFRVWTFFVVTRRRPSRNRADAGLSDAIPLGLEKKNQNWTEDSAGESPTGATESVALPKNYRARAGRAPPPYRDSTRCWISRTPRVRGSSLPFLRTTTCSPRLAGRTAVTRSKFTMADRLTRRKCFGESPASRLARVSRRI